MRNLSLYPVLARWRDLSGPAIRLLKRLGRAINPLQPRVNIPDHLRRDVGLPPEAERPPPRPHHFPF